MATKNSFAIDEWYHCFNRGVDKRAIFDNENDANRFLMLLYLCNGSQPVYLYNTHKPDLSKAFQEDRGKPLVAIGAFCLMPNHYHLLVKEISGGGVTSFMRKLGTAYTMYFNMKYERVGHLFCGKFRSRHVANDPYFQKVLQYIHCKPAELYEVGWKSGKVRSLQSLEKKLVEYPYSSLGSYAQNHSRSPVLSPDGFEIAHSLPPSRMLEEARAYYADVSKERFER